MSIARPRREGRWCRPALVLALRGTVRRLCLQRVDVIFAYLDLADPGAPAACVALEGAGFFVGGIFPGHPFPHTLVLQYPNNVSVDCEQVKAYSPLAQELRAYVAREQAAREAVR